MTIRVQDADGTIIEFPDDTPQVTIASVMRQRDQERDARARAGATGVGGVAGRIAGAVRGPTQEQRQQVALQALQRQQVRGAAPLGVGYIAQQLVNMTLDPARRREVGNSLRGAWRDIQQIPSIDFGRLARDTSQSVQQGVRDLPQTLGSIAQNLPQVARGMTYGPFEDEENAQRQIDMARLLGDAEGEQQAAREANLATGGAVTNAAAPALFARPMSMLQAGGRGAALSAPHALSRGDPSAPLQERLPGALTEIGAAATFTAGGQGVANAIPRIFPPTRAQQMVERMDRAGASVDAQGAPQTPRGVTPSLATANGGVGVSGFATKFAGDNIIGGVFVRPRVRNALTETRDAAHDIRDAYGRARGREDAGRVIQQGLTRFADDANAPNPNPDIHPRNVSTREWSFPAQSAAVFDEALRPIASNPAALTNTRATLQAIMRRADDPAVREFRPDPVLRQLVETLADIRRSARTPTLRDLRKLRSDIRAAQSQPRLGPDATDNAALQRIEQALTEDIYAAAGPHRANLQAADQFYRKGMTRIDGVRRFFDPENPANSIQQILRAANPRTENARVLAALRSALPDREWRVIAASIIDEMGAPRPGAAGFTAEQAFSVENFATAYRAMTPAARKIIFGSRAGEGGRSAATMRTLAADLDNLAEVALAQKGVERSANFSGSGRDAQNFATFGLGVSNLPVGAATVAGIALTGEALTNPAFVRWLVSARRAQGPAGMRRHLAHLRDLAARDPALYPVVAELESRLEAERSMRAPRVAGDRASTPPQREPAFR